MYAVIKTGGKQYRVEKDHEITIEKLEDAPGSAVVFGEVLMLGGGTSVTLGKPTVPDAAVRAEVLDQVKGPKVYTFRKRRRKHSSKRLKGHRQNLTVVRITEIMASGGAAAAADAAPSAEAAPE